MTPNVSGTGNTMDTLVSKVYYVLKLENGYWTGWNCTPNVKSAKKYISQDDLLEDVKFHSFELDGTTSGECLEIHEKIELANTEKISWKS